MGAGVDASSAFSNTTGNELGYVPAKSKKKLLKLAAGLDAQRGGKTYNWTEVYDEQTNVSNAEKGKGET